MRDWQTCFISKCADNSCLLNKRLCLSQTLLLNSESHLTSNSVPCGTPVQAFSEAKPRACLPKEMVENQEDTDF